MNTPFPLAGLNIVVTRPQAQAKHLARSITQNGGNAILFPLLEILPAADPRELLGIVSRLPECDLAIFISPNAVRYGMDAIRSAGQSIAGIRVAAVGQGSAKALRGLCTQQIIAPHERFDSEALLALPELQDVADWRILIFRGDGGRELLGDTLRARGAHVEYAECYRRSKPPQGPSSLLAANPDAITVFSSEALGYLWEMLDEAARIRLRHVPVLAPHERIAETARRLGWAAVTSTPPGDDGMLSGLIAWAQSKDRKQPIRD